MRILVVEDDAGIADGLRTNLQQRGYAVDVCDGVAAAWGALRAESFDAVLLDLGLADGEGSELLHRLRTSPPRGDATGAPALPLGVQRVKHQTGFARTAGARHHRQLAGADVQVQVAKVVLACATDANGSLGHGGSLSGIRPNILGSAC